MITLHDFIYDAVKDYLTWLYIGCCLPDMTLYRMLLKITLHDFI